MSPACSAGACLALVFVTLAASATRAQVRNEAPAPAPAPASAPALTHATTVEEDTLAFALAERQRLRPFHIVLGNLTWAASNVATLLGLLHFSDRYGWDGNPASSGCASGSPILGAEWCTGVPWPHAISVSALTVFYGATFTIAAVMPDPLGVGEGSGELATLITAHRALRWVTLGLIVAQIVLGAVVANAGITDFDTRRNLAATHLALGATSWGTMTAMGILGSLMAW